jgi:4-amino-4-deoxy-L-arabinose transferase-like glycosyltransferase
MVLDQFTTPGLVETAITAITALVGLYIGYQAYRGLRRHDSPPMRYLSAGLILLFGVTYAIAFAGNAVFRFGVTPLVYQGYFRISVRLIQLAGVSSIAYALYLTRSEPPTGE